MKSKPAATQKHSSSEVLRFAHPFFTPTPIAQRPTIEGLGHRMTDFTKTQLEPIPDPQRDPTMMLAEIIGDAGVADVEQAGKLIFHAVGDTGTNGSEIQKTIADAMSGDFNTSNPGESPAFFFHLGDVNYYKNNDEGYHEQFYEPYRTYPGKIIAIPGNHDGELFKWDGSSSGQTVTLEEFQKNFCQSKTGIPPAAGTIYREMISQPGVYWYLNTEFIDIIGLYSNMAENPGFISAQSIGTKQKDWLTQTLKKIADLRDNTGIHKLLLIATHHPPYSGGGHSSSTEMLIDIDDSCTQAGVMPDAFLSAHSHNIQCYTRYVTFDDKDLTIPYILCGGGGRPVQPVPEPSEERVADKTTLPSSHTLDKSAKSYGYATITAKKTSLLIVITTVEEDGTKTEFASINIAV